MIIITPNTMPVLPSPTAGECATLITYANNLVSALETVQARLYEISDSPDEALLAIRNQVSGMLASARTLRSNLYSISADAKENVVVY